MLQRPKCFLSAVTTGAQAAPGPGAGSLRATTLPLTPTSREAGRLTVTRMTTLLLKLSKDARLHQITPCVPPITLTNRKRADLVCSSIQVSLCLLVYQDWLHLSLRTDKLAKYSKSHERKTSGRELYRNSERREILSPETPILQRRPLKASDSAGLGRGMMTTTWEHQCHF